MGYCSAAHGVFCLAYKHQIFEHESYLELVSDIKHSPGLDTPNEVSGVHGLFAFAL